MATGFVDVVVCGPRLQARDGDGVFAHPGVLPSPRDSATTSGTQRPKLELNAPARGGLEPPEVDAARVVPVYFL